MIRISVCMPTYNGSKYIKQQLESILLQLSAQDEIIISDDSSTDDTLEIIRSFEDPRIKIFEGNRFKSPVFNLENALSKADGEFIFLADQDDIWLPNKVETILEKLNTYDLVVSDCELIDDAGNVIFDSFYKMNHSKSGYFRNLLKNGFLGCCLAFKGHIGKSVLPFPKRIAMHDIWIGLVASLIGRVAFIDEKLIQYRRHGGNFSFASSKSKFPLHYKIYYRIEFLIYSISRYMKIKLTQ